MAYQEILRELYVKKAHEINGIDQFINTVNSIHGKGVLNALSSSDEILRIYHALNPEQQAVLLSCTVHTNTEASSYNVKLLMISLCFLTVMGLLALHTFLTDPTTDISKKIEVVTNVIGAIESALTK